MTVEFLITVILCIAGCGANDRTVGLPTPSANSPQFSSAKSVFLSAVTTAASTLTGDGFNVVPTSSGSISALNLSSTIAIGSNDAGKVASLFIVAILGDKAFFLNSNNNWAAYDGINTPAYKTGALPASISVTFLNGQNVTDLAGLKLYAGYGVDFDEMASVSRYKQFYTITNTTAAPATSQAFKSAWTIGATTLRTDTTSTCTLYENGVYTMYLLDPSTGEIKYQISTDGLNYTGLTSTGIKTVPSAGRNMLRNPGVIKLTSGSWLMLYEAAPTGASNSSFSMYRAISADGKTFADVTGSLASGAVFVGDATDSYFIGVPELTYFKGELRMYYVGNQDKIYYATSGDDGKTWIKKGQVTISGLPAGGRYVDPEILTFSDGTMRLIVPYGTSTQNFSASGIISLTSTDGVTFTYEKTIVTPVTNRLTLDPDIVLRPNATDSWIMYSGVGVGTATINLYAFTSN